jgi:CheY-like chemotaxis protein
MVTDVVMPGISGRALAERLTPLRPNIKVLYCSGYAETTAFQNGILDLDILYLQKPFTPDALLEKIRGLIPTAPTLPV